MKKKFVRIVTGTLILSLSIVSGTQISHADTMKADIRLSGGYFPSEILQGWNFDIMPVLESFNATSTNIFLVINIKDQSTGDIKLSQTESDIILPANSPTLPTALMMQVKDSSSLIPGKYTYDLTAYHDFVGNKHNMQIFPLGTLTVFASMPTTTPQVQSTSPAQGDILTIGKKYDISWRTNTDADGMPVSLLLIDDNSYGEPPIIETIASGLRNTSSYSWRVEDTIKPGNYKIRIAVNPSGLTGTTIHTSQFSIVPKK